MCFWSKDNWSLCAATHRTDTNIQIPENNQSKQGVQVCIILQVPSKNVENVLNRPSGTIGLKSKNRLALSSAVCGTVNAKPLPHIVLPVDLKSVCNVRLLDKISRPRAGVKVGNVQNHKGLQLAQIVPGTRLYGVSRAQDGTSHGQPCQSPETPTCKPN